MRSVSVSIALCLLALMAAPGPSAAQYFGKNKVQYERFDFRILQTPHFDIYYYPEEHDAVVDLGRLAERWYARLSVVFDHRFEKRQPIVIYASHTHFRQTTVISEFLGDGIGGVTEHLKGRVVLPFAAGLGETDHVLGHELVHAFQRDILRERGRSMALLPLWFVEGMAEYLSIGRIDPNTAMWLRDAAGHNTLPRIDQLDSSRYFPYRYGQALWTFLSSKYGEDVARRCLTSRASGGAVARIVAATGADKQALSAGWHEWIRRTVASDGAAANDGARPVLVISQRNGAGRLNVAPSLSPDGTQLVFLSERSRYSIDVFVADIATGIKRRLLRTAGDPHFDSLQFIDSAGAWNRTGRRFVLAAVADGQPVLTIFNMRTGSVEREIRLAGVDQIFNPTWSPDGQKIAFSALKGGLSDLYLYERGTGRLRQLTNDLFADLQPAWSPDGASLAFSTDRFSSSVDTLSFGDYQLATIDIKSGSIRELPALPGAKHIDPHWSEEGRDLYFVADAGGVSNVYRLTIDTGEFRRITDVTTGVSGVTALSPALSVAGRSDRLAYSVYTRGAYELRVIDSAPAARTVMRNAGAVQLTDDDEETTDDAASAVPATSPVPDSGSFAVRHYGRKLSVLEVGQPYLSAGGGGFGGFLRAGLSFSLGDMLGEQRLHTAVQAGKEASDFAIQSEYFNQRSRWNWGISGAQIPWLAGAYEAIRATPDERGQVARELAYFRQVHRQFSAMAVYPFSSAERLELGAGVDAIGFTADTRTTLYSAVTGQRQREIKSSGVAAPPVTLVETSAALVRDTSISGPTGPVLGERYRIGVTPTFGQLRFATVVADYRKYLMPARPFTVAVRTEHVGRYGPGASDSRLMPLVWTLRDVVRGYGDTLVGTTSCDAAARCTPGEYLNPRRFVAANVELRFPLLGVLRREVRYGPLPLEGLVFGDAAGFWTRDRLQQSVTRRTVLRSAGAGVRLNAGGFLFEFDGVRRLGGPRDGWTFAVNFRPGF